MQKNGLAATARDGGPVLTRSSPYGLVTRVANHPPMVAIYLAATALYILGIWLHIPYGGGHIYSDIVSVFQTRECTTAGCSLPVPYVQGFNEYPVIVAMFMFIMGAIGRSISAAGIGTLLQDYYYLSTVFLLIPTLLIIRELFKLLELRGKTASRGRVFWYLVLTPTFVYVLLVNWYAIGVYFALAGLRRYLQNNMASCGLFFGLSAASNFVTAIPALGLFLALRKMRDRMSLILVGAGVYALLNIPFIVLNWSMWLSVWQYISNWYIEGSWILILFPNNIYSPYRHYVPPLVFGVFLAVMLWYRFRKGVDDPLLLAAVSMFGYIFATYIYTPQLNLTLLPFFILLPMADTYWEFITFDLFNALIIILGFSQALQPLGITYNFHPFEPFSFVWGLEVIRSLWVGKFAVFNGVAMMRSVARAARPPGDTPQSLSPPTTQGPPEPLLVTPHPDG